MEIEEAARLRDEITKLEEKHMKKATTPPWKKKRKNTGKAITKLTPEQIEAAKDRASANGRRYPNLIDNMWAARHVPCSLAEYDIAEES